MGLREHGFETELVRIETSGDRGAAPAPGTPGLKGLFVAEIVRALQEGEVDLAVHSAKDLPSEDQDGIVVAAVPERASPFDLLVSRGSTLSSGARVGSSSLRRRAQLRIARPELDPVEIRGNVDTRLRKMEEGEVDGVLLAAAGLSRLGIEPEHSTELNADEMMPAPGQGCLAIHAREGSRAHAAASELDHAPSHRAFDAERRLVHRLGALAVEHGEEIELRAIVLEPDGSEWVRAEATALHPFEAADAAAEWLLSRGADAILAGLR